MPADTALMEKLTALCKRRGFIYPGSEIYGGLGGFWDYGPLGVELKRHIKDLWWRDMVLNPPPGPDGKEIAMLGIDAALIMNPKVWEASGHVGGFSDPMVDCKVCKRRFRADQVWAVSVYAENTFEPDAFETSFDQATTVLSRRVDTEPQGPGWVASIQAASPAEALSASNAAIRAYAKEVNDEALKSFTISRSTAKRSLAMLMGEVKGGARYQGLAEQIGKIHLAIDSLQPRPCPECFGELTEEKPFNLMFETYVGAVQTAASKAYLRPETAQGIFVNYRNVLDTSRIKLPFGIAQVGKAFRNEINPRNYTFRSREFEQMEIEFFCHPDTAKDWYEFWCKVRQDWYVNLGLRSDRLRPRPQTEDELAHYSKYCTDIEYLFPFSDEFQELEGVAHRGNYDLTQHAKHSGKDLSYFDDELWQRDAHQYKDDKDAAKKAKSGPPYRYLPTVIEPSAGVDRTALAFLCEAYTEDEAPNDKGRMEKRVVMKFHPKIAPIKAAFFPLVNKAGMPEIAESLYRDAKKHLYAFYDAKGAIGRRYRRQDEAGTPFCITVDGDTIEKDGTVTIRDRDTLLQVRVAKDQVVNWLQDHLL